VRELRGEPGARDRRIALVASRFNEVVVTELVTGALGCLRAHGIAEDDLDLAWVPGAFELPLVARELAVTGRYDAVVCLGAVIRGETTHYDAVVARAVDGIGRAADDTGVPVLFGVLTTDTLEQALERAGGSHGNKGWDAAMAAMEMTSLLERLPKDEG
jgi:6,7-dimethyl-8-ribityllumazine synthase